MSGVSGLRCESFLFFFFFFFWRGKPLPAWGLFSESQSAGRGRTCCRRLIRTRRRRWAPGEALASEEHCRRRMESSKKRESEKLLWLFFFRFRKKKLCTPLSLTKHLLLCLPACVLSLSLSPGAAAASRPPSNGRHDAPRPRGRGEARRSSAVDESNNESDENAKQSLVAQRDDRPPALRPGRRARAVPRRRGAAGRGVLPMRPRHRQSAL